MPSDLSVEELRSQLARRAATRSSDRDVARLLSPWRRHRTPGVPLLG